MKPVVQFSEYKRMSGAEFSDFLSGITGFDSPFHPLLFLGRDMRKLPWITKVCPCCYDYFTTVTGSAERQYCSKVCCWEGVHRLQRGVKKSPELIEKNRLSHLGQRATLAQRKKIKARLIAFYQVPANREFRRRYMHTKEYHDNASNGQLRSEKCKAAHKRHKGGKRGIKRSKQFCENLRSIALRRVDEQCRKLGLIFPYKGDNELFFLGKLQSNCPFRIDLDFRICGYVLDGYIHELHLAIEFDEPHHLKSIQAKRDQERMANIIAHDSKISFWRVNSSDYNNDPNDVIQRFKLILSEKGVI
jgi:very-short-patch-repair endonuclease